MNWEMALASIVAFLMSVIVLVAGAAIGLLVKKIDRLSESFEAFLGKTYDLFHDLDKRVSLIEKQCDRNHEEES